MKEVLVRIGAMRVVAGFLAVLGMSCLLPLVLPDKASAQAYWQGQGFFSRSILVSADLVDGKLHVVKRIPSNITYCEGGSPADSIVKYIYAASNGVVVLERTVEGKVIPPSTTPEKIEWPDEETKKAVDSGFKTVQEAMDAATASSSSNRYMVVVEGDWASNSISLKKVGEVKK